MDKRVRMNQRWNDMGWGKTAFLGVKPIPVHRKLHMEWPSNDALCRQKFIQTAINSGQLLAIRAE
jgi:hypothetical protein